LSDSYIKIEGDRSTLHSSGQDLASASKELAEVTHVLNKRVEHLVRDAGWSGAAAGAFKQDWLICSTAGDAIIQAMADISTAMEHLAVVLKEAQDDLDDAKDYAMANDIALDSFGQPLPTTRDISEYLARAEAGVEKAKRARDDAALSFASVVSQLAPGGKTGSTLGANDDITLADAARALYGLPAARTAAKRGKLERLNLERLSMKRLHRHIPKQSREWRNFQGGRLENRKELRAVKRELMELEKLESKWKFSGCTEVELFRLREKLYINRQIKMLDSVPAIGSMVALGGIYLGTKDDMEKGWGFWHSVGVETGTTLAAVAAGAAVDYIAPESAGVSVPLVGGVNVGYGAGTYAGELFKSGNWEQNIHSHGVVSGLAQSFGDAGKTWWNQDFKGLGVKIKNSAVGVWNDVF
jgi:uncharacterized protein YukE